MKKSNAGFYAVLTFIIALGCFLYSWKVLVPKSISTKKEIANVEAETKAASAKLESLKVAKSSLEQIRPIADQLFIAIPGDKDAPNLITELEAIAAKYQILIPSIQIADSAVGPQAAAQGETAATGTTVSVSFAINSSFENLNEFIKNIEKDIRFMNVKTLSMTVNEKDTNQISMTMQIEAFKRASSKAGAAGAASVSTTGASNE